MNFLEWRDYDEAWWRAWKPGPDPVAVCGMPDHFYHHVAPHFSSSQLKVLLKQSPMHVRHNMENPEPPPNPKDAPISARLQGSILHAVALEPDTVDDRFVFAPGLTLSKNPDKAKFAELLAEAQEGRKQLVRYDRKTAEKLAAALHRHGAWNLVTGPAPLFEVSIFWIDRESRLPLKVRPDALNLHWGTSGARVLSGDLKSIEDASTESVRKQVRRYLYDLSAVMYRDGCAVFTGREAGCAWYFFEKAPPYAVRIIYPGEKWYGRGGKLYKEAKVRLLECLHTGIWPGYDNGQPVVLEWTRWDELDTSNFKTK